MTDDSNNNQDKSKLPVWLYVALGFVISIAVIILSTYFSQFNDKLGDQNTFGLFGDFVGGTLNPLLGFFTVVLLIWSIRVQMRELELTREEISAAKGEAKMSRIAMEEQVQHFSREADLNELNRLLKGIIDRYHNLLNEVAPSQSALRNIFGNPPPRSKGITFKNVIYGSYEGCSLSDEKRVLLREHVQLRQMYYLQTISLIRTWYGLYVSYQQVRQSKSFQMAMGLEWHTQAKYVADLMDNEDLVKDIKNFEETVIY